MQPLDALTTELLAAPAPAPLPQRVLVYGAGGMGRRVVRWLRGRGIEPVAVLDRAAALQECEGLAVHTAKDWRAAAPDGCRAVVVAVHNPGHPVADVVTTLHAQGFGPVWTPVDLCNIAPTDFADGFWLAPRSVYDGRQAQLAHLDALFEDETSRVLLRQTLRLRIGGDYAQAPPREGAQYCAAGLPRWARRLRLVDCGAFTGDSLDDFHSAGYTLEAAVCLEPDPANYAALCSKVRAAGLPVVALPCAVSDKASLLRFSAEAAGSSHLQTDGATTVQALGLDEALAPFAPNLIKMDIEGAEPAALAGATETIRRYRPGLALSVYHRAEHLWEIPLQLARALDDYRFFLRAHSHNSFDLVLYAMPRAPSWQSGEMQ